MRRVLQHVSLIFSAFLGLATGQSQNRTFVRDRTEEDSARSLQALPFLISGKGNFPQIFYGVKL